jgi:hypothetical protein
MEWLKRKLFVAYRRVGLGFLNWHGKWKLDRLHYVSLLASRPPQAIAPVWSDLWFLYRTVRARKPKVVLEFGSGCSSIIMAQALADNARQGSSGFLHSLDSEPHWGELTIASLPMHLKPFCEVILTAAVPTDLDGTPVWRYRDVPDVVPDFIYLDGPKFTKERRAAVDVLDIEDRLPQNFCLLVDARLKNCALLERHFKRHHHKTFRPIIKNTTYELTGESPEN